MGSAYIKQWKYDQQMQFLVDYMTNRNTRGSVYLQEELQLSSEHDQEDLVENYDDNDAGNDPLDETSEDILANITVKPYAKGKSKTATAKYMTLKTLQQQHERATMRQEENDNQPREDELFDFFMSIHKSVKNMPLKNQLKMKRKIFNIVLEEEELLCSQNLD